MRSSQHKLTMKIPNCAIVLVLAAVVLCVTGGPLSCSGASPSRSIGAKNLAAGEYREQLGIGDGRVLRYSMLVPEQATDQRVPLILALHYGGPVTEHTTRNFIRRLVAPAFKELDALIIAPDCPGRGWANQTSERALLSLLDHALETLPVDPARVVVMGYSMGGIGSWFLAARHPDRFSAAIPVAGRPVDGPTMTIPIFAVHSKNDEVVDYRPTQEAVEELRANGRDARLLLLEDLTHYDTGPYAAPLSRAVPWLSKLWVGGNRE